MRGFILFLIVIISACSKVDEHNMPIGDPVDITYEFTADTAIIQGYRYYNPPLDGFKYGESEIVDTLWVHSPYYYANSDFRRGGIRFQVIGDSLQWNLKVYENSTLVWDTSGVSYKISHFPTHWFQVMKDW